MVQTETNLVVADNSGAKSVRIFRLYGGSKRKSASIGDVVLCSVKAAIPNGKIKKGDVVGQAIFQKFLVTDDDTAEGERVGGFGSTNK